MEFNFNQTIVNSLSERMKLEEIPLPQGLKSKDSLNKEKKIKNRLYKSERIERVVLTEILTSNSIENHNGLIYPGKCYDFPIFDFMFHLFEGGVLAVTEFYPLRRDKSYLEKYISPMEGLHQESQKIPEPMPNTFEWIKDFSSGNGFFLGSTKEHVPEIEKIFRSYLELWIGYVEKAKPVTDQALKDRIEIFKDIIRKGTSEGIEQIKEKSFAEIAQVAGIPDKILGLDVKKDYIKPDEFQYSITYCPYLEESKRRNMGTDLCDIMEDVQLEEINKNLAEITEPVRMCWGDSKCTITMKNTFGR